MYMKPVIQNPKLIYKLRKAKFRIVGLQAQNYLYTLGFV